MIEIRQKHTIIVTIDKATLDNALSDPYVRLGLEDLLKAFRPEDCVRREGGSYCRYEVMA